MDVIIIGGGPAGLMAAITAAKRGLSVSVFEKNKMLGRKLRITGKGRCNVTNACDFDELLSNIPQGSKFMMSSLRSFDNHDLMNFFEENGLPLVIERGNRVFPESQSASDVADCLKKLCKKLNIEIYCGTEVTEILVGEDKRACGIRCGDSEFHAKAVILATGGLSYPLTGSTGDGYKWAEQLGHKVTELKPSLVGLYSNDKLIPKLQGLSLKNIGFRLFQNDKKVYEDFGELLFTDKGISGPVVLSGSRTILKYGFNNIKAEIDLKPALDDQKLYARIQRDFQMYSRKQIVNSLGDLLPKSLISVIIKKWKISENKFVNQITKEERERLVHLLKHFTVTINGSEGFERAVVTAGGIDLKEINPKTMESKLVPGLFFAGEILDVDAYTGGFNLTVAFTTGAAAGRNVLHTGNKT